MSLSYDKDISVAPFSISSSRYFGIPSHTGEAHIRVVAVFVVYVNNPNSDLAYREDFLHSLIRVNSLFVLFVILLISVFHFKSYWIHKPRKTKVFTLSTTIYIWLRDCKVNDTKVNDFPVNLPYIYICCRHILQYHF